MHKDRFRAAEEIEDKGKSPLDPALVKLGEHYSLPVKAVDLGLIEAENPTDEEFRKAVEELEKNSPELIKEVKSQHLDMVAHQVKDKNGKIKWVLILGFGFAALATSVAVGYKLVHKHNSETE